MAKSTHQARGAFEKQGCFAKLSAKCLQPVLQPRFAIELAVIVLTFSFLVRPTGVAVEPIQAADLNPLRILGGAENKVIQVKDRIVKYYENVRLVYEIEQRLNEFSKQQEASGRQQPTAAGFSGHNAGDREGCHLHARDTHSGDYLVRAAL